MVSHHFKTYLNLIVISFLILCDYTTQSQELTEFNHKINDSINGQIKAEIKSKNDSTFVGKFDFLTTFENIDFKNTQTSLTYKGNYDNDKKTGRWSFSYKSFKTDDNYSENNYKLNLNTSGKEYVIKANFREGLATDTWRAEERYFKNSIPGKTNFTINAEFEDARLINTLKANFPNLEINFSFDNKGFADGEWILNHEINDVNIKDIISFEKGVFKNRKFEIEDEIYTIYQLGLETDLEDSENLISLNFHDGVDNILDLMVFQKPESDISTELFQAVDEKSKFRLNQVLSLFKTYKGIDIWNNFKGSAILKTGIFKVKTYPLSQQEKSEIEYIRSKTLEIHQKIDNILNNTNLEIGKLNYEELNIQESVLKSYQSFVSDLLIFNQKLSLKEIAYINRNEILPEIFPQLDFPDKFSYSFKEEQYRVTHDFPELPKNAEITIHSISELVNKINEDVLKSEKVTAKIFQKLSKKEALSEQEQELVDLKNKLINLYSNKNNNDTYNTYHNEVSKAYLQIINDNFKTYVNLNIEKKEQEIDEYLNCFKSLENSYKYIEDIPLKLSRLDELYSKTTFDPFMMANMTERLKSRIYRAFEDYLLPYIIEDLKTANTCDAVENAIQLFDITYKRLVVLIDEETKDKEKLLKREKNPQVIMEILNIKKS